MGKMSSDEPMFDDDARMLPFKTVGLFPHLLPLSPRHLGHNQVPFVQARLPAHEFTPVRSRQPPTSTALSHCVARRNQINC